MNKSMFIVLSSWMVCLCVGLCVGFARADDIPTIGMEVGQQYPDLLLPDLDGGYGKLSDYRGQKVLLIHFASW